MKLVNSEKIIGNQTSTPRLNIHKFSFQSDSLTQRHNIKYNTQVSIHNDNFLTRSLLDQRTSILKTEESRDLQKQNFLKNILSLWASKPNNISLQRYQFHYLSVDILGSHCPMIVNIQLQEKKAYIKIYGSSTYTHPNKFNSEFYYHGSNLSFRYSDRQNHKQFHDSNLYLAVYSEFNTDVTITFNFIIKGKKHLSEQFESTEYLEFPEQIICQDKVIANLDIQGFTQAQRFHKRLEYAELNQKKMIQVIQNKKNIMLSKRESLEAKLQAQDLLKEVRQLELRQKYRVLKTNQLAQIWISLIYLQITLSTFEQIILKEKTNRAQKFRITLLAKRVRNKAVLKMKVTGKSLYEQSLYKSSMVLKMYCRQLKRKQRIYIWLTIKSALQETGRFRQALHWHSNMTNGVNKVQRCIKKYLFKVSKYKEKILTQIFKNQHLLLNSIGITQRPHIDRVMFKKVIEQYWTAKKQSFYEFVRQVIDQHKCLIGFISPPLFNILSITELCQIVKIYALKKGLLMN